MARRHSSPQGLFEKFDLARSLRTAPPDRPSARTIRFYDGRGAMTNPDPQQQQMIREAMKAIAERRPGRTKLVYNKDKRTIEAISDSAQAPRALNITAEDADMFGVATVSSQWLREHWVDLKRDRSVHARFNSWDDGDAYTQVDLGPASGPTIVDGTIVLGNSSVQASAAPLRVVMTADESAKPEPGSFNSPDGDTFKVRGWRKNGNAEEPVDISLVEVQPALAMRRAAILETDLLREKSVLCIGLGTGGAHAAVELAKCGVGNFTFVDRDRLTVGNVVRHPGGVSQVGRYKVNVLRDLVREKNPDARVDAIPEEVTFATQDRLRELVGKANIVICGTDNRPSKLLINKLCVDANVPAIYGGAFRRAYGGQVLRVRPRQSPCHQCFVQAMPDEAADVEVSTASDAAEIAYSDRPVAVEPGLSLDVLPIANMVAKLALLELVSDTSSSLKILRRDFDAPWYLWLNRPEPGTQYANWPPLSESSDEMTINRWYGIYFDREPGCPVCGGFFTVVAAAHGLDMNSLGTIPSAPAGSKKPWS
jgi:molybdopterin/thiamine biosynthesis adenylyltransferase